MNLEIWRLHPKGITLQKAEKTLNGTANEAGVKWCAPYSSVNSLGWWIFSPIDVDICWLGGKLFEHRLLEPWDHDEHHLVTSLVKPEDHVNPNLFAPVEGRSKFTFGAVEEGVVQIWTGCVFKTPPDWWLHLRSPINFPSEDYTVMEGILETGWMQYDIWINLVFKTCGKWVKIRKNAFPPLAQIVPVRRESVEEKWEISDQIVNRDTPEADSVFSYWLQYNQKKFGSGGKQYLTPDRQKDSTTFWRERKNNENL